jgi:hypothetical protein
MEDDAVSGFDLDQPRGEAARRLSVKLRQRIVSVRRLLVGRLVVRGKRISSGTYTPEYNYW